MTDLQDRILDKLVGTRVGVNWPDGPLTIAAEVVGGTTPIQFGVSDFDRTAKNEIARRLGFHVLLCEAIQGANRGLAAEDDRRTLAMTLFGQLPIGEAVPKLGTREQTNVAARIAIRVHPFVCPDKNCPVPKALAALVEAPKVTDELYDRAHRASCKGAGTRWKPVKGEGAQRLRAILEHVLRGFQSGAKSVSAWCSIRESSRVASSESGIAEAVACCLEIARLCKSKGA